MVLRDRNLSNSRRNPVERIQQHRSSKDAWQERAFCRVEVVVRQAVEQSTVGLEEPAQPCRRVRGAFLERKRVVRFQQAEGRSKSVRLKELVSVKEDDCVGSRLTSSLITGFEERKRTFQDRRAVRRSNLAGVVGRGVVGDDDLGIDGLLGNSVQTAVERESRVPRRNVDGDLWTSDHSDRQRGFLPAVRVCQVSTFLNQIGIGERVNGR